MLALRWCSLLDEVAVFQSSELCTLVAQLAAWFIELFHKLEILILQSFLVAGKLANLQSKHVGAILLVLQVCFQLDQIFAGLHEILLLPSRTIVVRSMARAAI